ncbi:hypothetical protein N0V93_000338 [Gnomoniopsis smithogilvyi]|uniref:Calpain catalytic domain-containing protein n=1 Tax=Gnomoniopsis smithogilvyi TaxID=1191159 RepID=A0A9W8Z1E5_9PEZI|nr:hypothetical protein N0V93_000338 [Gnomoniopsis smithogilvyi]
MSSESASRQASPVRQPTRTSKSSRRKDPQTPQQKIDEFWGKYKTKAPGKELPERAARRASAKSKAPAKTTEQSYEAAANQCRRKVAQIVSECRRVNQRYRDPHFDLEIDQKLNRRDCLDSLDNERDDSRHWHFGKGRYARASRRRELPKKDRDEENAGGSVDKEKGAVDRSGEGETTFHPKAVKRVVDIFDAPEFYIDGPTANDVRQGRDGDCWLMAALCTLSNKPGLIERCCVAHDQAVGVYGFVFHRDGEWFSEIIDDKLYLTKPDYDESLFERILWEDRERVNSEEAYRKAYQSNSGALYFAQCVNPNETWLPLLEKAYAKAHGDYSAIEGGYGGEGVEDLTGGVTSEIYTTDILDKEYFWNEELMKVNQDFLFGCSTGVWGRGWGERKGIVELHAYSVLKAREIDGVRLVLLKNPWGKHEWKGPWSDGSKEWTAEWLQKLDHKFGDDGSFWISYDDLLRKYQAFDRTRLFSPEWKVASIWTTLDISWTLDYHDTKFAFSLSRSGPIVIVFSQLDERYFKGLEGQYRFELSFRVHKAGEEDYVVRSQNYYRMNRSVNVELDLDAGEYVVVVKIDAQRNEQIMPVDEVVRAHAKERREKLLRIGQAYDLAHAKGKIIETVEEKEAREAYETRRRERDRRRMAKFIRDEKVASRKATLRRKMRERKRKEKEEAKCKARAERKAARREAKMKAEEEGKEKQKAENKEEAQNEEITVEVRHREEDESAKESTTAGADKGVKDIREGGHQAKESSETSKDEEAGTKAPTEEKHVKIEAPPDAKNQEGSTASTDPGEGAHTPASSTISCKRPAENEGEETQEDEAYVTAAEETVERKPTLPEEEPSTPKPTTSTTPSSTTLVDIGVQTGPGLPMSPPPPSPPPRRGPPPPHTYMQSMYGHPRPLPPGVQYAHGPPRDLSHIPPHLRAAYAAQHGPPISVVDYMSESSDSELDEKISDEISDVSEISEEEVDAFIAENRVRAARAATAAAAAAKVEPPGGPTPVAEEPLDEFEKDPWNAVGVFGLRVYYKMPEDSAMDKDAEVVKLRVERPNYYVWDESSDEEADDEKEDEKKEESQVLDVDDSAKDAVGETPPTPGVELLKELSTKKKGEKCGEVGDEVDKIKEETKEATIEEGKSSSDKTGQFKAEKQ